MFKIKNMLKKWGRKAEKEPYSAVKNGEEGWWLYRKTYVNATCSACGFYIEGVADHDHYFRFCPICGDEKKGMWRMDE